MRLSIQRSLNSLPEPDNRRILFTGARQNLTQLLVAQTQPCFWLGVYHTSYHVAQHYSLGGLPILLTLDDP